MLLRMRLMMCEIMALSWSKWWPSAYRVPAREPAWGKCGGVENVWHVGREELPAANVQTNSSGESVN